MRRKCLEDTEEITNIRLKVCEFDLKITAFKAFLHLIFIDFYVISTLVGYIMPNPA